MDMSATPTMPRPLTVRTRLTIALLVLLAHSPALTIATGLCLTHLTTCPLWRALAWSLLLGGWVGAIVLLDWGFCWYFITRSRPPPHHSISLGSFGTPARAARTASSSTTTELYVAYATPSQEPLDLATRPPHRHTHDPTAPIPYYDPTVQARYEWERSWARKPVSPPAHDASALVHHESEGGQARRLALCVTTNAETSSTSQPAIANV